MELKKLKGKRYSLFLIVNISLFFVYNISFKFRIIRHVFEHHNVIKFRFAPRKDALKTYCKDLVFVKFDNNDFKSKNLTNMKKLASRLKLTRTNLFGALFNKNKPNFDNNIINELEDRFLLSDIGVKTTDQIIQLLTSSLKETPENITTDIQIKQLLLSILEPVEKNFQIPNNTCKPYLILVVGVNGVGKTTTIGKLTRHLKSQGKSILLAAADTFRAAATEQLSIWAEVNDVKIITQSNGSDPGAVVYNALQSARSKNIDVLIVDTAGRLHNKKNLMDEIKKINDIGNKFDILLKKETFLILDAGTGQNALTQAKQFHDAIGIDRIILTKLDGTAKGGIVFALANELKIPISFIGIGEKIDDLQQFNASEFVDALLDNNS